ncbi:YidH family protein [Nocardia thailandica]|uniref:YidH family protein n=1 Tax=Nocardia thailandica TaxID=257275 RepID=A0ABW6PSF0_9NOCA|nr:DUF202 domain-containing protein [Nocardia thailandica]
MTLPDVGAEAGDLDDEPDYRFTLANERTFLAWTRTAVGLLAGGVAVRTLVEPLRLDGLRLALSVSCLILAVVVAVGAYLHWRRVNRAIRAGDPLPGTVLIPVLTGGITIVAALACLVVLLR